MFLDCNYFLVYRALHMLEYPLYNPVRDKFPLLFENIFVGGLKAFFQLDQQVDISLYS